MSTCNFSECIDAADNEADRRDLRERRLRALADGYGRTKFRKAKGKR